MAADRWTNHEAGSGLHDFVHDELNLTADQEERLDALEARFAVERARLEGSARAANARLAQAMENEHEYGPEVSAAIDEVHARMGRSEEHTSELQALMRNSYAVF